MSAKKENRKKNVNLERFGLDLEGGGLKLDSDPGSSGSFLLSERDKPVQAVLSLLLPRLVDTSSPHLSPLQVLLVCSCWGFTLGSCRCVRAIVAAPRWAPASPTWPGYKAAPPAKPGPAHAGPGELEWVGPYCAAPAAPLHPYPCALRAAPAAATAPRFSPRGAEPRPPPPPP